MKKIYGTFGVEMRAYGQKSVKFCTHTDTRGNLSSIDNALRAHRASAHGGLLPHSSPEDPVIFRIYILHAFNAGQMASRGKLL